MFRHVLRVKFGFEGSSRSLFRSGCFLDWLKTKERQRTDVMLEAEKDWSLLPDHSARRTMHLRRLAVKYGPIPRTRGWGAIKSRSNVAAPK